GFIPGEQLLHRIHHVGELARGDVGWSAAAKINEFWFPAADERLLRVKSQLLHGRIEIRFDLAGIFVCIHFEVAEVAALPAERNMDIDAQWSTRCGRAF